MLTGAIPAIQPPEQVVQAARPTPPAVDSQGFASALEQGLQQVSDLEHQADALIQDVATGGPTKVHEVMVANSQSALAVDLLVQVRDRGLEAYQEIMRLQL